MPLEKLEKLHELKEKRILTEDEFEQKKRKLLKDTEENSFDDVYDEVIDLYYGLEL